jgi:hypothetical protein
LYLPLDKIMQMTSVQPSNNLPDATANPSGSQAAGAATLATTPDARARDAARSRDRETR